MSVPMGQRRPWLTSRDVALLTFTGVLVLVFGIAIGIVWGSAL